MSPILALENISKRFGAIVIADGIDLALAEGEALGVIGPNGAGKTTLFGIMSGTVAPDGGRVMFEGGDVTRTVVPCDGSIDPDSAAGSNEAAVVAIRSLGSASASGVRVVPSVQPVFVLPGGAEPDPSLTIQRIDRQEPPIRVSLFGRTLDLKQTGMKLTPGGLYSAICGDHKVAFKIADNAGVSKVVTLQRVVRF